MDEAVRDAIRRMRESDENDNRPLYEAIMLGERQIANGQYKPYTPALFEEIQRNAVRKASEGTPLKPEAPACDLYFHCYQKYLAFVTI